MPYWDNINHIATILMYSLRVLCIWCEKQEMQENEKLELSPITRKSMSKLVMQPSFRAVGQKAAE